MSKCFLARQETAGRLNQVVQTSSNIGPWWGLIYQIGRHLTLLGYLFPRGHLSLSVWSLLSIPDAIYSWVALSVVTLLVLSFFKTLLRHGANPDLRDEDGKTPMDKARERNDEGHREVVHILQSPGIVFFFCSEIWRVSPNQFFVHFYWSILQDCILSSKNPARTRILQLNSKIKILSDPQSQSFILDFETFKKLGSSFKSRMSIYSSVVLSQQFLLVLWP